MATELVNDGLDTKHEELVSKMEAELQVPLTRAIVEDGIHKGHNGRLEIHLVSVDPRTAIQIIHNALSKYKLKLLNLPPLLISLVT
jgi:hypothetical protein